MGLKHFSTVSNESVGPELGPRVALHTLAFLPVVTRLTLAFDTENSGHIGDGQWSQQALGKLWMWGQGSQSPPTAAENYSSQHDFLKILCPPYRLGHQDTETEKREVIRTRRRTGKK